ncbi:MAG TPA: class I adenylate-forming enzyme family protein [Gammaproteobacteria bacterium]|nr:class I adenylate-forming enzyme family protein [Gammaproteobacteria bacterium]
MSGSALSAAVAADSEHVVSFRSDGSEQRWPELIVAASRVSAALAEAGGTRWALNLDDTFEFAAAMLGCWAAGKTPVLAPRPLLEGDSSLVIDGVIQAAAADVPAAARALLLPDLTAARGVISDIAASSALVLYTSGSTGTPKEVTRRLHNVEAELEVFETLWGARIGEARFYSTVSHRHVYGMLFRLLWPLLRRRPFATFDLEYPEQLLGLERSTHVLVSSPALLKRIGHLSDRSAAWRAIFSSGGLLPAPAARDAARVLGACPIEVLGSTETSGVATREQVFDDATAWKAVPSVATRASADGFLEVRSAFTGQSGWLQMGDMVRFSADGIFELLGRGDHLAKIEDKRISLAEIERHLLATPWVEDAAALAFDSGKRQYVGVVVKLSAAGVEQLRAVGRRRLADLLKQALRPKVEAVALPRKFRYVDEIPINAQGKRIQSGLEELFRSR